MNEAVPTEQKSDGGPCVNTDRHLWPQVSDPDSERESIHVTAHGFIGINVGGYVYEKPLREWHRLAGGKEAMQPMRDAPVAAEERDWRAGCECNRVGLCYRCQAAARIEWLERFNAATENELKLANTRRQQADLERDIAIDELGAFTLPRRPE